MAKNEVAEVEKVALPAFLQEYQGETGTEDIGADDVSIPRIKIGQSMTPEVKDKVAEEGDLIHSITKQVLAKANEPIRIIVISRSKNYILWRDRKNGGGVFAHANRVITGHHNGKPVFRYAWDKPNSEFEDKINGMTKVKYVTKNYIDEDGLGNWGTQIPGEPDSGPAATEHHNYVVLLPDHDYTMAAISLARSQVKKAKDFNALLKLSRFPVFARIFELRTVKETSDQGQYYNYEFRPVAGKDGLVTDERMFNELKAHYEAMKERNINVDYSDGDDVVVENNKAF